MERKLDKKFYANTLAQDGTYTDRSKTMLLVVDIQPKIMKSTENGKKATKNTVGLIKAFKEFGMPVKATEQYPKGLGRSDEKILKLVSDKDIYEKTSFDGLVPGLKDFIKENKIENVCVTGTEGHVCVYQTIRSLLDMGINVFYVDDAITSYTEKLKKLARRSLVEMGAVLVNTELVLFDLANNSKDEKFKFVSNLVKDLRK